MKFSSLNIEFSVGAQSDKIATNPVMCERVQVKQPPFMNVHNLGLPGELLNALLLVLLGVMALLFIFLGKRLKKIH
ncbi:MAG: hypothetical protein QM640_04005 [Niabella sp.]